MKRHARELKGHLRIGVDAGVFVEARGQGVDAAVADGGLRKTGTAVDSRTPIDGIETVGLARDGANSADRGERGGLGHFAGLRHCSVGKLERAEHSGVLAAVGGDDARLRGGDAGTLGHVGGGAGLARIEVR